MWLTKLKAVVTVMVVLGFVATVLACRTAAGQKDDSAQQPKLRAAFNGHTGRAFSVVFSPDGKTLATGGTDKIKLWEVRTGEERATLKGHTSRVRSVAYSPDGKTLASGSDDQTIKLWDVKTGT
jgi:predicted NACHT family NTPase